MPSWLVNRSGRATRAQRPGPTGKHVHRRARRRAPGSIPRPPDGSCKPAPPAPRFTTKRCDIRTNRTRSAPSPRPNRHTHSMSTSNNTRPSQPTPQGFDPWIEIQTPPKWPTPPKHPTGGPNLSCRERNGRHDRSLALRSAHDGRH